LNLPFGFIGALVLRCSGAGSLVRWCFGSSVVHGFRKAAPASADRVRFCALRSTAAQVAAVSAHRRSGIRSAAETAMGARTFKELHAWQLANELKVAIYRLVEASKAERDFGFRDQLRDAAASAPRNIAEGFGRTLPAISVNTCGSQTGR
jgi:hypothetical protein